MSERTVVLVTRPSGPGDPLVVALEDRGYTVAAIPTVATRDVAAGGPLDAALASLAAWEWIVVTSATGARAVGGALARTGPHESASPKPRWAAVGPATAAELGRAGIRVDLVPDEASGLAIARELIGRTDLPGSRVLLARTDAASPDLPAALREAGAEVDEVIAYHTLEGPRESGAAISAALADEALAVIVVASGSAVRGLVSLAADAGHSSRLLETPLVSMGPRTTAVARELGFRSIAEAAEPSVDALATAVEGVLRPASPVPALPRRLP